MFLPGHGRVNTVCVLCRPVICLAYLVTGDFYLFVARTVRTCETPEGEKLADASRHASRTGESARPVLRRRDFADGSYVSYVLRARRVVICGSTCTSIFGRASWQSGATMYAGKPPSTIYYILQLCTYSSSGCLARWSRARSTAILCMMGWRSTLSQDREVGAAHVRAVLCEARGVGLESLTRRWSGAEDWPAKEKEKKKGEDGNAWRAGDDAVLPAWSPQNAPPPPVCNTRRARTCGQDCDTLLHKSLLQRPQKHASHSRERVSEQNASSRFVRFI